MILIQDLTTSNYFPLSTSYLPLLHSPLIRNPLFVQIIIFPPFINFLLFIHFVPFARFLCYFLFYFDCYFDYLFQFIANFPLVIPLINPHFIDQFHFLICLDCQFNLFHSYPTCRLIY